MNVLLETLGAQERRWKRYPAYKDSGIEWLGAVPEGWEVLQLRRVIAKFVDYRGATPKKVPSGTPLITAKNIKNGAIDLELSQEFIREEDYDEWMVRGLPEIGDVLVTTEAPLGESAQIEDNRIALAQRIILLKRDKSRIINDYLKYHFLSQSGKGELWSRATGSTAIGIKASRLKETLVIVPPIIEQISITQYLDRETAKIDALAAKKERLADLLEEKRTALISHAVTKGLDPDAPLKDSGIEWLGAVPEGWKVEMVKWFTAMHKQGYYTEQAYIDEGVKLSRITDIDDSGNVYFENMPFVAISPKDESSFKLKEGDFLFARSGTIGRFGVVKYPERSVFASYLILFRFKSVEKEFLRYSFGSHFFKESLLSALHGGANQNVHAENIKEQSIAIPPRPEQHAIAAFLDRETTKIDALAKKIYEQIEKLKEYRTALISSAVTGKIDVRGGIP